MNKATIPFAEIYGPVESDLAVAARIFDEELASALPHVNELCDVVRSCRGKMLRPALLLLSGKAVGNVSRVHHRLAAVVEMVHAATLVHDDVLDEADERRGRAPVNAVAGNAAAVLLGDYLISHAFHLCSGLRDQHASRRIGATTNVVCEGELLQNFARGDLSLDESGYLEIVRRKTGALTATSCELGAYAADAEDHVVEALRCYGMSVGVAFQIIDDLLDIVGDRDKVGKTLGSDLALGKLTLPTIHCLRIAGEATSARLRDMFNGCAVFDRELLCKLLARSSSVDYAISVANDHVSDALGRLDSLPPSESRASLATAAEFIVAREF